ncbi:hypothetical protein STRDD11_01605 [Streptococcus sp. DD11]|nr:hypothetical protein STRDD11_01605 [Streptococcus sp. DD11]
MSYWGWTWHSYLLRPIFQRLELAMLIPMLQNARLLSL